MTKEQSEIKPHSVEEGFGILENIIASMEDGSVSLEDSFELYKKGMEEVKYLNDSIKNCEAKIRELKEDGTLEDFE